MDLYNRQEARYLRSEETFSSEQDPLSSDLSSSAMSQEDVIFAPEDIEGKGEEEAEEDQKILYVIGMLLLANYIFRLLDRVGLARYL